MKRLQTVLLMTLLIAGSVYGRGAMSSEEDSKEVEAMMSPPETPAAGAMMMAETEPGPAMMSSGGKVAFTNLDDARFFTSAGPTVLFFNADWCPICREDMLEIDSRLHELGNITVVVVDYDRSGGLTKNYGITYQHTYVQIDGDGNKIALWNGGGLEGILDNVVYGGR